MTGARVGVGESLPPLWTERRRAIARYLIDHIVEHGHAPSFRELGRAVGIKKLDNVARQLRVMREHGAVTWRAGHHRSLVPLMEPPEEDARSDDA